MNTIEPSQIRNTLPVTVKVECCNHDYLEIQGPSGDLIRIQERLNEWECLFLSSDNEPLESVALGSIYNPPEEIVKALMRECFPPAVNPLSAPLKHTPGPWRIEDWKIGDGQRPALMIVGPNDAIAEIESLWIPEDRTAEMQANATLIALAPELLELALKVRSFGDRDHKTWLEVESEFHPVLQLAKSILSKIGGAL